MRYFPILVDLDRQPVLVVGGGEEAVQKVRLLRKSMARIEIVAPGLNQELSDLMDAGKLDWIAVSFNPAQLDGKRLVYAASNDTTIDALVSFAARARSIPVNAVDQPQFCSFITPSIVDRDPVTVAISTEGAAPVLGRQIRSKIEAMLPANLGSLACLARSLRSKVAACFSDGRARRRFWEGFFNGPVAQAHLAGDHRAACSALDRLFGRQCPTRGRVSLVGAGPGDPDLLTFKAMRKLQEADVIVADRLAGAAVLEVARRDARRIMVGKMPGKPSPKQAKINEILLAEVQKGQKVVRLKGGDPFVFGRGGEELEFLQARGVEVDVVPGVSAALACAAAINLPLTLRHERRSLTLMTGYARDGAAEHDWRHLSRPGQMLAIYMGVGAANHIQARLLSAGIDPKTPVTIVENGTLSLQKLALGTIADLTELVIDHAIKGPAIIYVGAHPRNGETMPKAASGIAGQPAIQNTEHEGKTWSGSMRDRDCHEGCNSQQTG